MRVLSVTHGPTVPGGVFEEVAAADGHQLVRWSPPAGTRPAPARDYDAVLVFGGAMHPDQDELHGWLAEEVRFLRSALAEGVPVLGVCLGSQLLARAAGAAVGPAPAREIGWLDVELTPAGRADPVLGMLPERTTAFQWHSYTFAVPPGAVELARSDVCAQAFRLERAWGIQFHAEVTAAMVDAWIDEGADELPMPRAALRDETARRISAWNAQGRALAKAFLAGAARARGRVHDR